MQSALRLADAIDRISRVAGLIAAAAVLAAVLISAGNAVSRYALSLTSNAWLELQWYLFAATVMLGGAWTLRRNEHVRVDLVYGSVSDRGRLWIDTLGLALFLLPGMLLLGALSWPVFDASFAQGEVSANAGGLLRWPVKLLLPIGFALVFLQGVAELIRRIAALKGIVRIDLAYERPQQ